MPFVPASVPAHQRTRASLHLRYEDITQDGRLTLLGIPHAGAVIWDQLLLRHPVATVMPRAGVLPILSHLTIEGTRGPLGVGKPVTVDGAYQLARGVDAAGQTTRLFLLNWIEITAPASRTHGPPPPNAGEPVVVGRMMSESVFTRPFGALADRKVLRFEWEGLPEVPTLVHKSPRAEDHLTPADWTDDFTGGSISNDETRDAIPLEPGPTPDDVACALGLAYTDSNQHVNSLVYPRLFEDAALRRFHRLGLPHRLLGRRVDLSYRKPFFAGEAARAHLRLYALPKPTAAGETHLATGVFLPEGAAVGTRPSCYVRMSFAP